ncbi:MAG: 30S ribosomal protein S17 [Verrucomicrobiota bacterium]
MSEVVKKDGKKAVRKERVGEVVSEKMNKTIVVKVTRSMPHPQFRKFIKTSKKFYVHDEKEEARVGDRVRIAETPPRSKTKRWELAEIVKH